MLNRWVSRVALSASFASVLLALGSVAWAYIPASGFMLKNIMNKRTQAKSVRLRSTVSAMEGARVTEVQFKQLTVFDATTRVLKSHAYDSAGVELYSVERKFPDTFTAQNARAGEMLPTVSSLLMDVNPEAAGAMLRQAGIPIRTDAELLQMKDEDERRASEISSLARVRNQVAWVIGPGPKDLMWPQLWIEKDGFLPLRLIMRSEEGMVDLRFEAFRFQGGYAYPGAVTVYKASKSEQEKVGLLRDELVEVSLAADPKELKASTVNGFTDAGNSTDSSIRDLIRRYYNIVR